MKVIQCKTEDLIPYENNPRKNEKAVDYVAESIKEFGFKSPIIVDENNVIIAGHTRLEAAKKLGLKEVPVIKADDLTPEQAKAFRLADNKTAEFAEWDYNMLGLELGELAELNINMEDLGFDVDDFDIADFGEEFELPDGEKGNIESMSFILATEQAEAIRNALSTVRDDVKETFGNENKNGNALYEVIRQWEEQKK